MLNQYHFKSLQIAFEKEFVVQMWCSHQPAPTLLFRDKRIYVYTSFKCICVLYRESGIAKANRGNYGSVLFYHYRTLRPASTLTGTMTTPCRRITVIISTGPGARGRSLPSPTTNSAGSASPITPASAVSSRRLLIFYYN